MIVARTRDELQAVLAQWRSEGRRWSLVPTMGNLHAGHLRLVSEARQRSDRTVVSIFVNPTQFGPNEDFAQYPRSPKADQHALESVGADLLFMPEDRAVYPAGPGRAVRVEVPELGKILCGKSREGHFDGVAMVVTRLFALCGPDVAVFGEKDFQQLLIIRHLSKDLGFPVDIVGVPTVREPDGLAMSSRNQYLTDAERQVAPALHALLVDLSHRIQAGGRVEQCIRAGLAVLEAKGFRPEYLELRDALTLDSELDGSRELVWLVAARLGAARLIDNERFPFPADG